MAFVTEPPIMYTKRETDYSPQYKQRSAKITKDRN